ncbi:MAG: alkaline phosphatase D family protein [Cellvibrionaceae bacterium]
MSKDQSRLFYMDEKDSPLICGPILRYTTTSEVFVWCATDSAVSLEGEIYNSKIETKSNHEIVKLGPRLFIHLISIKPKYEEHRFLEERFLEYDIFEKDKKTNSYTSILAGDLNKLVYKGFNRPSFIIQGSREKLRVIFSSCRKPHGVGVDASQLIHERIKKTAKSKERPHALFLTGDQIYADDIPDILVKRIDHIGKELMGGTEHLPDFKKNQPHKIRVGERQQLVHDHASFTSTHADNHLLTFGDYAAMYLLAWSEKPWKNINYEDSRRKGGSEALDTEQKKRMDKVHETQKKRVDAYKEAVPMLRRAMANIPTYMIFDDHEVTDDWNINEDWKKKVQATASGKRIVANALAAYWAFQAAGNLPSNPKKDEYLVNIIQKHLKLVVANSSPDNETKESVAFDEALWKKKDWAFVAPTWPPALFMDTRTNRGESDEPKPLLLSNSGWKYHHDLLIPHRNQARKKHKKLALIVIAPSPAWGFIPAEMAQDVALKLPRFIKRKIFRKDKNEPDNEIVYTLDAESWRTNSHSMEGLMNFMHAQDPSFCIVISGDVHYGFSRAGHLIKNSDKKIIPFIQLTSSPSKNETYDDASEGFETSKLILALGELAESVTEKVIKETAKRFLEAMLIRTVEKNVVKKSWENFTEITKLDYIDIDQEAFSFYQSHTAGLKKQLDKLLELVEFNSQDFWRLYNEAYQLNIIQQLELQKAIKNNNVGVLEVKEDRYFITVEFDVAKSATKTDVIKNQYNPGLWPFSNQ